MTRTDEVNRRPADQIPVHAFRQIFHWPLSLAEPKQPKDLVKVVESTIGAPWKPVRERPDAYEEGVYFHDVVQDFLYPGGKNDEHLTFARHDLTAITFTIEGRPHRFKVVRLELDLFRFGTALLTLDIEAEAPGTLADVQTIVDHARRAFPGFWFNTEEEATKPACWVAGLCPSDAEVTIDGQSRLLTPASRDSQRAHWKKSGRPMLFPWWLEIARPLVIDGQPNPHDHPVWRHVLDERIPVMSYISVTNPGMADSAAYNQIGEGDWYRIAAADEAGDDPMPYNADFLRGQATALFYDRFHHGALNSGTTRHCFAGYHYAMVGAGPFFDTIARPHFQSHYRKMLFIAHLEFSALLTFSRRISDLVRDKGTERDEPDFRRAIHDLQRELLRFVHRFSFADISNHLQSREMNLMLRDAMGLDALRADLQAELAAASDFANASEAREATQSQVRLTEFASLFLPASLAAGFGGMNMLAGIGDGSTDVVAPALAQLSFWTGMAYAVGAAFLWLTEARERVLRYSLWICGAALAIAALIWTWEAVNGTPFWPDWPDWHGHFGQQERHSGSEGG
ncbi:MAG: hypothetical protein JJT81_18055 [Rubellimicrobium sp.]|nr:hypothetical protein [Rubellimicrobium sp.]